MGKFNSIKKWLSVMLVVLLGFVVMAFVGCGEEATNNNANTNNNNSQTDNGNNNENKPQVDESKVVSKLTTLVPQASNIWKNKLPDFLVEALGYYKKDVNLGDIVNVYDAGGNKVAMVQLNAELVGSNLNVELNMTNFASASTTPGETELAEVTDTEGEEAAPTLAGDTTKVTFELAIEGSDVTIVSSTYAAVYVDEDEAPEYVVFTADEEAENFQDQFDFDPSGDLTEDDFEAMIAEAVEFSNKTTDKKVTSLEASGFINGILKYDLNDSKINSLISNLTVRSNVLLNLGKKVEASAITTTVGYIQLDYDANNNTITFQYAFDTIVGDGNQEEQLLQNASNEEVVTVNSFNYTKFIFSFDPVEKSSESEYFNVYGDELDANNELVYGYVYKFNGSVEETDEELENDMLAEAQAFIDKDADIVAVDPQIQEMYNAISAVGALLEANADDEIIADVLQLYAENNYALTQSNVRIEVAGEEFTTRYTCNFVFTNDELTINIDKIVAPVSSKEQGGEIGETKAVPEGFVVHLYTIKANVENGKVVNAAGRIENPVDETEESYYFSYGQNKETQEFEYNDDLTDVEKENIDSYLGGGNQEK